ncbi:hypothetical protein M427DRAFT_237982 [Gonapodya prolifera JEL478]|uniref:Uncharacterized protein n=1 Tax=Gonapodya prolifera (strain JEL478) TaxID=1344416 RepID=A0A139AMQ1_GONPJ|nr:hypothetical protein M427DRAFT_237982 [Gonapodya prolifera JEL478]|eukprot:KXS18046.1 hypothetical protein M427DRAFT_237982 [Gonapodya prolifera JEL478]
MSPNLRRILRPSSLTSSLSRNIWEQAGKTPQDALVRRSQAPMSRIANDLFASNRVIFLRNSSAVVEPFQFPTPDVRPVIAFGNANFRTSSRGSASSPNRKLLRSLRLIHHSKFSSCPSRSITCLTEVVTAR